MRIHTVFVFAIALVCAATASAEPLVKSFGRWDTVCRQVVSPMHCSIVQRVHSKESVSRWAGATVLFDLHGEPEMRFFVPPGAIGGQLYVVVHGGWGNSLPLICGTLICETRLVYRKDWISAVVLRHTFAVAYAVPSHTRALVFDAQGLDEAIRYVLEPRV